MTQQDHCGTDPVVEMKGVSRRFALPGANAHAPLALGWNRHR